MTAATARAEFELAYPPSVNHYYRRTRRGVHRTAAANAFRADCLSRIWKDGTPGDDFHGPCRLTIESFPPDRQRRDVDNILKATLDALQLARVLRDDTDVCELTVIRRPPVESGKMLVRIERLEGKP